MALRAPFSPMHSDLNAFLFAEIGRDRSGMALTVASAMARSGLDPWAEAARLAALSPAVAIQGLLPMLSKSAEGADLGDVRTVADRLVRLLPRSGASPQARRSSRSPAGVPAAAAWVVGLAIAIGFLAWTMKERPVALDDGGVGGAVSRDISRRP